MQTIINKGRRSVSIYGNTEAGPFEARLYVNCTGATAQDLGDATLSAKRFKSLGGARKWAEKTLAA